MTQATTAAATSQDALNAVLGDAMPSQGGWSDEHYLWLTDRTRRLVELTDGRVEVLPMPTERHQIILLFLYRLFYAHLQEPPRDGVVVTSGLRMRVREGKFREPDLLLLRDRSDSRRRNRFWLGADLVAEIVSPDDPARDLVVKRADYAEASVPEYWIVDPDSETVTVLTLAGNAYVGHGVFARGDTATSPLLDGVAVDVTALFDEAESRQPAP
jgi:Uma2 family endonuclease